MEQEKKDVGKWWLWILFLIILSVTAFTGLRYAGVFGERFVFKNSFQYKEARISEQTIWEATKAEIEIKLRNPDISNTTRANLEAQLSGIKIQLSSSRRK